MPHHLYGDRGVKATVEASWEHSQAKSPGPPWVPIPYISTYLHRNDRFSPPATVASLHSGPRKWLVSGVFNPRYRGCDALSGTLRTLIFDECAQRASLCRAITTKRNTTKAIKVWPKEVQDHLCIVLAQRKQKLKREKKGTENKTLDDANAAAEIKLDELKKEFPQVAMPVANMGPVEWMAMFRQSVFAFQPTGP